MQGHRRCTSPAHLGKQNDAQDLGGGLILEECHCHVSSPHKVHVIMQQAHMVLPQIEIL